METIPRKAGWLLELSELKNRVWAKALRASAGEIGTLPGVGSDTHNPTPA